MYRSNYQHLSKMFCFVSNTKFTKKSSGRGLFYLQCLVFMQIFPRPIVVEDIDTSLSSNNFQKSSESVFQLKATATSTFQVEN